MIKFINMISNYRYLSSLLVAIVLYTCFSFVSCKKEEAATFTTPSTYRFNSPTLVDESYYVLVGDTVYRKITDTLEDFIVDGEDLADSINNRLLAIFQVQAITSIEFVNGTDANITFARYDNTDIVNKFVDFVTKPTKYSFVGNNVSFDILPDADIHIDNFFLELRQCYQACDRLDRKVTATDTTVTRFYDFRRCEFSSDQSYISALQPLNSKIDTLAIYHFDVVFSKY
jgi:hypothetical protein